MTDWHLLALTRPETGRTIAHKFEDLKTVEAQGLCLVMMPAPKAKRFSINPKADLARALLDFQQSLEKIGELGPMLPGAFEARLQDHTDALRFIALNQLVLSKGLDEFGEVRQFQLAFHWDMKKAVEGLASHPEVREAAQSGSKSQLGAALDNAIAERKAELIMAWREDLHAVTEDMIDLPESAEDQVYHCVVLCRDEDALFNTLDNIDAGLPDVLKIKAMGPMPAVSFASISLETADTERLASALERIGVEPHADQAMVKSAYHKRVKLIHPDTTTLDAAEEEVAQVKADAQLLMHLAEHCAPLDKGPVKVAHLRRDGFAA